MSAAVTLQLLTRGLLAKHLAGWEIMEVYAGDVGRSDVFFVDMARILDGILGATHFPLSLRREVLRLCITFMAGVNQLSPGAYFLRRDFFPAISTIVMSPETEELSRNAIVFLSLLANFHRSDAAKLNPYIVHLRRLKDVNLIQRIYACANAAVLSATKGYQALLDDTPPTVLTSMGSILSSMRPDRALATKPLESLGELFKAQPLPGTLVVLALHDLFHLNPLAPLVLLTRPPNHQPFHWICSLLALFSYAFTHTSSSSSVRAAAYAELYMDTLLLWVRHDGLMHAFSKVDDGGKSADNSASHGIIEVRLCRQRPPLLPLSGKREVVCAVLDCCILWLRHNLHKRIEVHTYLKCVWVCHSVILYLQSRKIRLRYHWHELWIALFGLLSFLASKGNDLIASNSALSQLSRETSHLLHLCLYKADAFLPTPQAIHELVYELTRSLATLAKQKEIQAEGGVPVPEQQPALLVILSMAEHYQTLVARGGASTAKDALKLVAKEIDANGVFGTDQDVAFAEPRGVDATETGFRYACADALQLVL